MTGDKEEILTSKWWEFVRFSHFGSEMAEKLNSNKKTKDELRNLFKSQNDKLSYYDLF
jgi:hypothetical protein